VIAFPAVPGNIAKIFATPAATPGVANTFGFGNVPVEYVVPTIPVPFMAATKLSLVAAIVAPILTSKGADKVVTNLYALPPIVTVSLTAGTATVFVQVPEALTPSAIILDLNAVIISPACAVIARATRDNLEAGDTRARFVGENTPTFPLYSIDTVSIGMLPP
jgi:hypothetical protein